MKQVLAIVVLFVAIALFIGSGAFGWLLNLASGADVPAMNPAGSVAEAGVETLLTVDADAGVEAWLEKVCAISTADGCQIAQAMFAKGIQANLEKYQAGQVCKATARKMVSETAGGEGKPAQQIWAVEIQTNGWGEAKSDITAAIVAQDEDGNWVFETILPLVPSEELWKMLTPTVSEP